MTGCAFAIGGAIGASWPAPRGPRGAPRVRPEKVSHGAPSSLNNPTRLRLSTAPLLLALTLSLVSLERQPHHAHVQLGLA